MTIQELKNFIRDNEHYIMCAIHSLFTNGIVYYIHSIEEHIKGDRIILNIMVLNNHDFGFRLVVLTDLKATSMSLSLLQDDVICKSLARLYNINYNILA